MKYLILMSVLAFASSQSFARTITVNKLSAKAIIALGETLEIADHAMGGRVDMEISDIVCLKTVTAEDGEIKCDYFAYDGHVVRLFAVSSKDQDESARRNAYLLRDVLVDLVGAGKKLNASTKIIKVKSIKCHGAGSGHVLDSMEIETSASCQIIL